MPPALPPPPPAIVAQASPTDPALRRELLDMEAADQLARKGGGGVADVDGRHHARLIVICATSWPGYRRVGVDGAAALWLLIQHQDADRALQRRCLALLGAAVAAGDADPTHLAYLTDRVRVGEGRPQVYGTQARTGPDGVLDAAPVEDAAHLDERRRSLGLEPEAAYIQRLRAMQLKPSEPATARRLVDAQFALQGVYRTLAEGASSAAQEKVRQAAAAARAVLAEAMVTGWPGYRRVGWAGEEAASVIAMGQSADPAFQRTCLGHLQAAVAAGDAPATQVAYLTDVICVAEGRPQVYGTQLRHTASGAEAPLVEDPPNLDARRAKVGLPPMADEIARANRGRR